MHKRKCRSNKEITHFLIIVIYMNEYRFLCIPASCLKANIFLWTKSLIKMIDVNYMNEKIAFITVTDLDRF